MNYLNFILFLIPLISYTGIAHLFKVKSFFISMIIGLGTVSCIASIFVIFDAYLVKYVFVFFIILGALLHIYNKFSLLRELKLRLHDVLILISVIYFFKYLNSKYYIFETHDVLYFTSTLEMLIAEYRNSIKLFTYYPYEMASFHHLPGTVIASLLFLVKSPTLIDIINCRYFLIVLSLFLFIKNLNLNRKNILYIVPIFCIFIIYGEEISYSFIISSFFSILIIFSIVYF